MPQLSVQPSINDVRGQALLQLTERLGAIDLTPLLIYRLDSVPDSALLMLAWQFDMLAPQWQLGAQTGESINALTDIDSLTDIDTLTSVGDAASASDYDSWRNLLRNAIPLHRTRGTPYAIKTALGSLGWNNVSLLEGQSTWGGTTYPTSQGWAVFRVLINLAAGQQVAANDTSRISNAVAFFKPVRALLDSIWFNLPQVVDAMPTPVDTVVSIFQQTSFAPLPSDVVAAPGWPVADKKVTTPLYNAHFYHTGIAYGGAQAVAVDSGTIALGVPVSSKA